MKFMSSKTYLQHTIILYPPLLQLAQTFVKAYRLITTLTPPTSSLPLLVTIIQNSNST